MQFFFNEQKNITYDIIIKVERISVHKASRLYYGTNHIKCNPAAPATDRWAYSGGSGGFFVDREGI